MATIDDLKFSIDDGYLPIARARIRFPNGYEASVIFGPMISEWGDHGCIFEVAVMKNNQLCYDTPITNDVINNLDIAGVNKILAEIEAL